MKNILNKLKYKLEWMKIYTSPFKAPKIKFYIGRIRVPIGYFYPRRWVKDPDKKGWLKAIPIKWFGINVQGLLWKDKWDSPREECQPVWSLVICGLQIAILFYKKERQEWESYLAFEHYTDKTKTVAQRLKYVRKHHPNRWTRCKTGETTDYLESSLKKKWRS